VRAEAPPAPAVAARRAAWLERYRFGLRVAEQGTVVAIGDGIARLTGLPSAEIDEVLEFEDGSRALVFSLEPDALGAIVLEQGPGLAAGAVAVRSARRLELPVGDALVGRVVDPLGTPLDGEAPPRATQRRELDPPSPPILAREFVNTPLYTGTKIVDALIPLGRGQRQLLIGDNGLGKSSLAIDTVLHQKGQGVLCVYVLIGQNRASVASTLATLRAGGAMEHTVCVVAEATTTPGLKYLAPFAGCAAAEFWMANGRDTLIVYDDLTTHAQAYRELSLLLRRPPGREAYPGDIFYLHSRLLERSTRLAAAHGGGSMSALPIVETKEGEIAAYIPTNLISITDGQVYFDAGLFRAGFLPAIDITRSVSRIGGKAQHARVQAEAGRMKLDYLQFLELEVFTRFGARLEASAAAQIARGRVLRELLKQERLAPLAIEVQYAALKAFNAGLLEGLGARAIAEAQRRLAADIPQRSLTLEDGDAKWLAAVRACLGAAPPPEATS
jgi:F-type H+-transporting ATPase subunit alpha